MAHPHLITEGASLDSCLALTNWVANAGTLSLGVPPDDRYGSKPCVKITSGANTAAAADLVLSSVTLTGRIGVLVYWEDWESGAGSLQQTRSFICYVANDTGFINYFHRTVTLRPGWNYVCLGRATQVGTGNEETTYRTQGSPSWASAFTRIRVGVLNQANTGNVLYIRAIRDGDYHKPQVIIDFDDEKTTAYTEAFPVMEALNIKGSMNVISSAVGGSGFMTQAQLQEMYDDGWDMCNHTHSHVQNSYFGGTYAYCLSEIVRCENYLASRGWTRRNCHKHFAAPFGESTYREASAYRQAIEDQCFTGRTTIERPFGPYIDDPRMVGCMIPDGAAETLANQYERIRACIGHGGVLRILFHNIDASAAQTSWSVANFTALMQYLARLRDGGVIDMPTWTEWYEQVKEQRVPVS